ncbi:hypothetical protein CAEBREN_08004 [Caenorhabditis brenneri]|uniref:MATH domain-containing protein n=1 Tax=Caenorhabditis brenneri TaxID=135651 RepID=G0MUN7_CAEBE|nr:hypothetical protein CAEBREN_08004 [Caenorhabditis brenneri]
MTKQFVLTHVAENISKLENDKTMYGNPVTILNIPWKIGYCRVDNAFQIYLFREKSETDCCIENILELSHMYQAQNALRICEEYLTKDSNHSMKLKVRLAAKYKLDKLKKHVIESMKTKADVRSVMGPDLKELDASILEELLEKMTSF